MAARRGMRRAAVALVALAVAAVAVAAFGAGMLSPVSTEKRTLRVTVPPAAGAARVAQTLKARGLIRSPFLFQALTRAGGGWNIKAGTYELSPSMSTSHILGVLRSGEVVPTVRLTFPEGFTVDQMARRASRLPGVREDEFQRLASREGKSFEAPFALPANLEGYLFPDTYDFAPDAPAERVIQVMLNTFDEKVREPLAADFAAAAARGYDLREIVIMASLIEREARIRKDQPLIAAVLYNRLRIGMPLQVDATVQYVIGHRERVLYKDLEVDSPYNTYKVTGLPPGPICNPGVDAVRAALNPADAPYLYYTANPDGSHTFTTTLEHHVRATAQARAEKARQERSGG